MTKRRLMEVLERIREKAKEIADRIFEAQRVYVLAHADADGISAAATIGYALLRSDIQFQIRPLNDMNYRLMAETYKKRKRRGQGVRLLLDLGSDLPAISAAVPDAYVIDHHKIQGTGKVRLVNPREIGLETPTSVLTYFLAKRIDPGAYKYSYLPLIGARGDGMLRNPDRLTEEVLNEAVKEDVIRIELGLLVYDDSRSIKDVISSLVPQRSEYFRKPDEVAKALQKLQIDANKRFSDLSEGEMTVIREHFGLRVDTIYRIVHETKPMLKTVHEFATLINACCRLGHPGVALSVALGDRSALYSRAYNLYREYRKKLGSFLSNSSKHVTNFGSLRVIFYDDDRRIVPTIASMMYMKRRKPVVVIGYDGDEAKVSVRGRHIGRAVSRAARLVGGQGGGHEHAAGARIPKDRVYEFLETLDSLISKRKVRKILINSPYLKPRCVRGV